MAVHGSAVRAPEQHLPRARPHTSPVQHFCQRHACPLRCADGAEVPFLALDRWVEQGAAVAGALEGDDERLRPQGVEVMQAEAQRPFDEAANGEPEGGRVEVGDLEVIADVEVGIGHDHAADQGGDRRLAIERMRPMDHQAGLHSLLAGIFGIQRRHEFAHRHRRGAAAAGDHAGAGRGWVDVQGAGHVERL